MNCDPIPFFRCMHDLDERLTKPFLNYDTSITEAHKQISRGIYGNEFMFDDECSVIVKSIDESLND